MIARTTPMSFAVIKTVSVALRQPEAAEEAGPPARVFVLHGHPAHLAMAAGARDLAHPAGQGRHRRTRPIRDGRARPRARARRG